MTQNLDTRSDVQKVTGYAAGIGGSDQIRIALEVMLEKPDNVATNDEIYAAVNEVLKRKNSVYTLSEQGKASLRFFINTVATEAGYIEHVDRGRWKLTANGRNYIRSVLPVLRRGDYGI